MITFHRDVFLPDHISIAVDKLIHSLAQQGNLRYGPHARLATRNDRYGVINPFELPVVLTGMELIEVEVLDGLPRKVVMRRKMRDGRWLVLVVGDDGFVRTLWSNQACDCHATLRRDRYVQPVSSTDDCKNSTPVSQSEP